VISLAILYEWDTMRTEIATNTRVSRKKLIRATNLAIPIVMHLFVVPTCVTCGASGIKNEGPTNAINRNPKKDVIIFLLQ
jgi:hypothetical protein